MITLINTSKACYAILLLVFLPCILRAQVLIEPKAIIVDADMGMDYDDVGALAMIHAIAQEKQIPILATMCSSESDASFNNISIINHYFTGKDDIVVGVPSLGGSKDLSAQEYQKMMYMKYGSTVNGKTKLHNAANLYYKVLSAQPDSSITIISIGYPVNLHYLLEIAADNKKGTPSGRELVMKKVASLVQMGGQYPSGSEPRFMKLSIYTESVFQKWPGKIVFAGRELGDKIRTGKSLYNSALAKPSPIRDVYYKCMNYTPLDKDGHESWDQIAVLAAMMPELNFFNFTPGKVIINEDASNSWFPTGKGQYYLTFAPKADLKLIANTIDTWMNKEPKAGK